MDPWFFAHHPPGHQSRDHVWLCGGYYWCKGCVMVTAGCLSAIVIQLASGWLSIATDEQAGAVLATLIAPTLITSFYQASRRIKNISRFFLGASLASASMLFFVTERWSIRLALVVAFLAVRIPLAIKRKRRMVVDISD